MKLSDQAIGAIMMALQRGIMEQEDITKMIQQFDIIETDDGLVVENPPIVESSIAKENSKDGEEL